MPTTSPDSIYYADGTTPASLANITSAIATSVQNALNVREGKNYSWADVTARNAQTGMTAGETGYQIDNATTYIYDGSAWKIWSKTPTVYTPTFTAFTPSSATSFVYSISGGIVFVSGRFECSATVPTGIIKFSLPTGYQIDTSYGANNSLASIIGSCGILDASSGNTYDGVVNPFTTGSVQINVKDVGGTTYIRTRPTSATVPMTWANTDTVFVNFAYYVITP